MSNLRAVSFNGSNGPMKMSSSDESLAGIRADCDLALQPEHRGSPATRSVEFHSGCD
jgi:hypothetical protein